MRLRFSQESRRADGAAAVPEGLARFLAAWAARSRPLAPGDTVVLQQLDCGRAAPGPGLEDLFLAARADHVARIDTLPVAMANQDLLSTDSLRNAFFPEIFLRHTALRDFRLRLRGEGRFHVAVLARQDDARPPRLLAETLLEAADAPGEAVIALGAARDIPREAGLIARVQARSARARLAALCWEAAAPAAAGGRMVVLLRTYGRGADILRLLHGFAGEAALGDYAQMLANTAFVILDTSEDAAAQDYAGLAGTGALNVFALAGPNLGGGGNMSQVMVLVQDALAAAGVTADELLLLDDDLTISLESLRRNWAASLFRSDTTLFTLPVLRQSNPRALWEDGAFWGRFAAGSVSGRREVIRPHFLGHGRIFEDSAHLGAMARAHYPEYATFIFQSLPCAVARDLGCPAAFFLRGDDIEYSLRARARGHGVISNPNLASWHEPAHSYGQEYMSISHGLIVNLCHGLATPDPVVQFFLARAAAHLGIADPLGLELYATVLGDINGCAQFLEPGFAAHYRARLAHFRETDAGFERLPPEIVEMILDQTRAEGGHAAHHPFLYPDPEFPLQESRAGGRRKRSERQRRASVSRLLLSRVVLTNPHTGLRRVYEPGAPGHARRLARAAAGLYREIERFAEGFEALCAHYRARLEASAQPAFWHAEMARHPDAFAVLASGQRDD